MVPRGSSLVSLDCPPSHDRMGIAPLVALPTVLWTVGLLEALLLHCKMFWVTLTIFWLPQLHSFSVCDT